jgi:hypothetical protein
MQETVASTEYTFHYPRSNAIEGIEVAALVNSRSLSEIKTFLMRTALK